MSRIREKLIGPFVGGISASIWDETVIDGRGHPTRIRSITFTREVKNRRTEKTEELSSYRWEDLPVLMFALQQAQQYCYEHPLLGDGTFDSVIP